MTTWVISGCNQGRDHFGIIAHCSVTTWPLLTGQKGERASGSDLTPGSVLVERCQVLNSNHPSQCSPCSVPKGTWIMVRVIKDILEPGMPVILALRRLKQKDCKLRTSLGYIAKPCHNK